MIAAIKRIFKRVRSDIILNRIGSGRMVVYFENPMEEIAFKYIPGGPGKFGKYYAKHFGKDEYETECNSSSVVMGMMEGKPITRTRYENYHLIEGVYWNRGAKSSCEVQGYRYMIHN
jgi:hypothetical protein